MKKILFLIIRFSGLPFLFREFIQKNKVTIILFHDIDQKTAFTNFKALKKRYNIIRLKDFILKKSNSFKIPKKSLIITFDDGLKRNFEILPVIKEQEIPVTIFLCAGIIDTNRHYWDRINISKEFVYNLKKKPDEERLDSLKNWDFNETKEFENRQALSKEEIIKMQDYVDFQSHTLFHPCLTKCSEGKAYKEVFESKKILEQNYNYSVYALSYPHGCYSEREIELTKKAGYNCGITVDYGFNTIKTNSFKLKRICVNDSGNIDELLVKTSGLWDFFKYSRARIFSSSK